MKSKDLLLKDVLLIESALLYDLNKELKMQINEVPNAKVGIVAGSKSDQETVDKITAVLDQFGITWEYNILSAHRTPNATAKYAREAAGRGLQVLIGVAGLDSSRYRPALRRRPAQRRRCSALHRADAPGNPGGHGRHR